MIINLGNLSQDQCSLHKSLQSVFTCSVTHLVRQSLNPRSMIFQKRLHIVFLALSLLPLTFLPRATFLSILPLVSPHNQETIPQTKHPECPHSQPPSSPK